jgi:hypothetical protein
MTPQQPTNAPRLYRFDDGYSTSPLPPSVIHRCADTDSAHGIPTGDTDPFDYAEVSES